MHDKKKEAKMGMLKNLSKDMREMMGEGYSEGMKKVTVASDSEEGLEEGLTKAQEILKKKMGEDYEMEDEKEEMEDDMEELMEKKAEMMEDMSPEEIKAKIEKLNKMLEGME